MARRAAWVLNLDAELELAAPRTYRATRAVAELVAANRGAAGALLAPDDVVVEEGDRLPQGSAYLGRAWCPTPRALEILRGVGATPEPSPPLDVLRTVHDRAFVAALGQELPGAGLASDADGVRAILARAPEHTWLAKRAFGVAGRGQRRIALDRWSSEDDAWVARSLELGALQVEPAVDVVLELATHGGVWSDGEVRIGPACIQSCDAGGAWIETRRARAGELSDQHRLALEESARELGRALASAGYFGPYGVDAYLWRDDSGAIRLNRRGEVNPRYTMGWAVGMGRPPATGDLTPWARASAPPS